MPDHLSELEVAMLKYMEFTIHNYHRPVSFLDFMHFEVDGREYTMTHGTFRNKISKLRELGIVEFAYNSGIAFYTLKDVKVGKQATTSMTANRIGVLLQHVHRIPNIKKHPLYKCIKHHPFDKAAVHDLHLKFIATGLWSILSCQSSNNSTSTLQIEPFSKDIHLQKRVINDLEIQITIHHTDTVTVVIGCSPAPIVVDVYGVIRLSEALAKIEQELGTMIDQHASDINSNIDIPNHMSWVVTRWDFGIDGLVTYTGKEFFFSWHISQNELLVFYTKKWGENHRVRVEIQEFPRKALGKALRERLCPKKGS
jgi:DNA-binding transcriptional ArsR family regulator